MIFNKKTNYIRHISRKKPCAITDRKHITEPDKDYSEINEYENYLNQVFQNNNLETRVIYLFNNPKCSKLILPNGKFSYWQKFTIKRLIG
jgi:hypothetical protein